ncbi:MAG: alpha/beta hydrolase, partial [Flavobacteriales bacterium]
FSSLGGGTAGDLLEYRPRHFVPFMVPLYDKENSPSIHEPKHQWVFRPEMQFSLFDLEKVEYAYENQDTGKTEIIDLLEDTAGAALPVLSDLDLVYKLLSDENNALSGFGPDRELVLGVGDQQILVSLNENDTPVFQYLNNVEIKPEDYLALRLYQNGDEANVLWEYAICNVQFVPDYNRDGQIDMTDRNLISSQPKWRFWINDDNDKSAGKDGIGGSGVDMPGQNKDNADLKVSGIRDLVDFFPLYFDLKAALNMLPASDYTYRLSQKETALGMVRNTGLKYNAASEDDMSGAYLTKMSVAEKFKEINSFLVGNASSAFLPAYILRDEDLEKIKKNESNVFLFEGRKLTEKPLVLDIIKKSNKEIIITYEFPLEICGVTDMFAHKNFRNIGGGSGGREDLSPSQTKKPPCMVDNEDTLVFIHGYDVDGDAATATFAEVFKRLFHSGYNGNFYGVSWYGDPPGSLSFLYSHYHQAVVSAFNFAKPFADFVNGLPAKKKTVAAHSLGNMVTGVAIQDYGLKADNYFAIDAAVVLEAYGSAELKKTMHAGNEWNDYIEYDASLNKLFSSEWHTLFDENDNRKKLTWRNRLDKVVTTNVYNFFSSTEEVLREYPGDNLIFDDAGLNLGVYAFVKQEKYKGRKQLVNIGGASSPYAGWGYNFDLNTGSGWSKLLMTGPMKTYRKYTPIEAKEEIIDVNNGDILKTKPFFTANPPELFDPNTGSDFVTKKVKDVPDLKNYYTKLEAEEVAVRDWLLAEAFPATTLPMGANPNDNILEKKNIDMSLKLMTNTDSWPDERIITNGVKEWWHSDYKDLSYQHTYKFYNKVVSESK